MRSFKGERRSKARVDRQGSGIASAVTPMPRALRDLVTRIMIEILHRLNNDTSSHYVFVRFIDQMRGGVASIASFLAFRRLILAQFLSLEPRACLRFLLIWDLHMAKTRTCATKVTKWRLLSKIVKQPTSSSISSQKLATKNLVMRMYRARLLIPGI